MAPMFATCAIDGPNASLRFFGIPGGLVVWVHVRRRRRRAPSRLYVANDAVHRIACSL